jgi:hypothetical protein
MSATNIVSNEYVKNKSGEHKLRQWWLGTITSASFCVIISEVDFQTVYQKNM